MICWLCETETKTEIVFSESRPKQNAVGEEYSSTSKGYTCIEDLIKGEGIPENPCVECDNIFSTNYDRKVKKDLLEKNMCLTCCMWTEELSNINDPDVMIVDNVMYHLCNEDEKLFRGSGGIKFTFMKDDRIYMSSNVWCSGNVPKHFQDRIKNNAVIIPKEDIGFGSFL